MNSAVINIRTDPVLKIQTQQLADELGLGITSLINGLLRHAVRTRTVTFAAREDPSDFLIESLKKSRADIKAGRVSPAFSNTGAAVKWLKSSKKKYAHSV